MKLSWFNQLLVGSIDEMGKLTNSFMHQFSINRMCPKSIAHLFQIKQQEEEHMRSYKKYFVEAANDVANVQHETLSGILKQNLRQGRFKESIAGKPPVSLEMLLDRTEKHIRVEESTKPDGGQKRNIREEEKSSPKINNKKDSSRREVKRKHTQLNAPLVKVMYTAQRQGIIELPKRMRDNPRRAQSNEYCRFHQDKGTLWKAISIEKEIERLIRKGHRRTMSIE
ncbi:hypothetical protein DH2020_026989 [Rehmannia glutinosa]|uniref:Retrotransposon gag domain-containing protein n=1 Tax=Rehmannia glutinosa TaxID=99300 RepID=A0ABR0VVE3_REHGL